MAGKYDKRIILVFENSTKAKKIKTKLNKDLNIKWVSKKMKINRKQHFLPYEYGVELGTYPTVETAKGIYLNHDEAYEIEEYLFDDCKLNPLAVATMGKSLQLFFFPSYE